MMRVLLQALLLAVAATAQDPAPTPSTDPATRPAPPGPRAPVAGLRGVRLETRVIFDSAPEWPQLHDWTFAFPARARWCRTAESPGSARQLRYRYGEGFYRDEQAGGSQRVTGAKALADERLFALRRALLLWPQGADWKRAGSRATWALGKAGRLVAELGNDGLPASMRSEDPQGRVQEQLRAIRWAPAATPDARRFPSGFELHAGERRVWRETVLEVDVESRFEEAFYLPVDQDLKSAQRQVSLVREERFPADWVWIETLEAGTDLESARDHLVAQRARVAARLAQAGGELDPHPILQLDRRLRPTALRWRAETPPERAPEGWQQVPAFEAVLGPLPPEVQALARRQLVPLKRRAEELGWRIGQPQLRWRVEREGPLRALELLLPRVQ